MRAENSGAASGPSPKVQKKGAAAGGSRHRPKIGVRSTIHHEIINHRRNLIQWARNCIPSNSATSNFSNFEKKTTPTPRRRPPVPTQYRPRRVCGCIFLCDFLQIDLRLFTRSWVARFRRFWGVFHSYVEFFFHFFLIFLFNFFFLQFFYSFFFFFYNFFVGFSQSY